MNRYLPRGRIAAALAIAAATVLLSSSPAAAAWDRAHADGANTGFADVDTAPAGRGSVSVPGLGSFAPGAGPVTASDGTVYIGNQQGRLFAFRPDGRPAWSRDLPRGQAIAASPAVGADGTIYVVGVSRVRDHRVDPPVIRYESTLHRFVPGGGWLGGTPFPELYADWEAFRGRGVTTAPPNIWSNGGVEAVMVPAIYRTPGGYDLRLVAFSTGGGVMAETRVTHVRDPQITGGNWANLLCLVPLAMPLCFFGVEMDPGFSAPHERVPNEHMLPINAAPLPGVAVIAGSPWVIVSDQAHAIAGYAFSPGSGFTEKFRENHPERRISSPPTILKDGHSAIGTADRGGGALVFAQPSVVPLPELRLGSIHAAPTRLADDRFVVVQGGGGFAVLRYGLAGYAPLQRIRLPGESIASAAASRTHLFVSTASAFYTYDVRTMQQVSKIDWFGGGLSPPVIGPQGHVYAIASNILFVFPPPAGRVVAPVRGGVGRIPAAGAVRGRE